MNDKKLQNCLNSVGKACFVIFYEAFADFSLSEDEVATIIVRIEPDLSWEAAKSWRCRRAREIIKAGRATDALEIIINSPQIHPDLKQEARRIIKADTNHFVSSS